MCVPRCARMWCSWPISVGSEASEKAVLQAVELCMFARRAVSSYPGLGWPLRGVVEHQDRVQRDSIISVIFLATFDVRYYRRMPCVYGLTCISLQIRLAMTLVHPCGGLRPLEHVPRPRVGRGVQYS